MDWSRLQPFNDFGCPDCWFPPYFPYHHICLVLPIYGKTASHNNDLIVFDTIQYIFISMLIFPCSCMFVFCFLMFLINDALNTFLINGYIGVGNILIGKIPSGYLTGINLRSTACQTGAYTSRLLRRHVHVCVKIIYRVFSCDNQKRK